MSLDEKFAPKQQIWVVERSNPDIVRYYRDHCGVNVMPIAADGSKRPLIPWKDYQIDRFPDDVIEHFCDDYRGIGAIAGITSGNLEILDFDDGKLFKPFLHKVAERLSGDFVLTLPITLTPSKGYHIYYRCSEIAGNLKLAYDPYGGVAIETRGQGGYAMLPGSSYYAHRGGPYQLIRGRMHAIPTISVDQRAILIDIAKSFDQRPANNNKLSDNKTPSKKRFGVVRPGDEYNDRADWADILVPFGWVLHRETNSVRYWTRPGKPMGISATTGFCGEDLFYAFSSNVSPFEPETSYSKFAAYALLTHDGDFSKATQRLADEGWGYTDHNLINKTIKDIYGNQWDEN